MGLYAENYQCLVRLFAPQDLDVGSYISDVSYHLPVRLIIQVCHRYTLDLELTYNFSDLQTGYRALSAQLRVYTDARLAEAVHGQPGSHLRQILGPFPDVSRVLQHRLRVNQFLVRWLEYLMGQGHSVATLEPLSDCAKQLDSALTYSLMYGCHDLRIMVVA